MTTDNFSRITVESHISLYINTHTHRERNLATYTNLQHFAVCDKGLCNGGKKNNGLART